VVAIVAIVVGAIALDKGGKVGPQGPAGPPGQGPTPAPTPEPSAFTILKPDPSVLEWSGEAKAGGQTCGFVKVPLSYMPEHLVPGTRTAKPGYPTLKVKFCVWFATTQPAPKGTIFYHCGGPSSVSQCDGSGNYGNGTQFREYYNGVSVDQRGLGASLPSLEGCDSLQRNAYNGVKWPSLTISDANDDLFAQLLSNMADANAECFELPEYQFKGPPQGEGSAFPDGQKFNFLMHSGTQALANDMNVFRMAIGAEKLSLNGGSYGTAVVGAFATTFPRFTDKFVSNSPVPAYADSPAYAMQRAEGTQLQFDYQLGVCQRNPKCLLNRYAGPTKHNKDLTNLLHDVQQRISKLPDIRKPSMQQVQARIDTLSADTNCDVKCKQIYGLFAQATGANSANFETVFGQATARANERGDACAKKLKTNDVSLWKSDEVCNRVLVDSAQGALTAVAADMVNRPGAFDLRGYFKTNVGGMNGDLLDSKVLELYVPFAKAIETTKNKPLAAQTDALLGACVELIWVREAELIVKRNSRVLQTQRRRNAITGATGAAGTCLKAISSSQGPPVNVVPCKDECGTHPELGQICLADLLVVVGSKLGGPLLKQNFLGKPTENCEPTDSIQLYSEKHKQTIYCSNLPKNLQDSMKLQHMVNRGGGNQINSEDRANSFQQVHTATKQLHKAQGTFTSENVFGSWVLKTAIDYAWPVSNPQTVMGAAGLGGIVIGSLYDPNTAYRWAQEMKGNFEKTSLITTAFVTHFMDVSGGNSGSKYENKREAMAYAKTCTANVFNYLLDIAPQPEDGLFCPAPEPRVKWDNRLKGIIDDQYEASFAKPTSLFSP
jgi:pimeloyl-ACP methyl ester carboxylesterase